VPQTHERRNRKRCTGWLRETGKDALYLVERVRIGFLRLSGPRIDRRVAGRVLPLGSSPVA
jgi:hypothetical protein